MTVPAAELDNYNPDRFDATDNGDGTFTLTRCCGGTTPATPRIRATDPTATIP